MWIAKDKEGCYSAGVRIFKEKPERLMKFGAWSGHNDFIIANKESFPKITWEDEPREIEIVEKRSTTKLNINKDFSNTPGGRDRESGSFSAEEFREDFLVPKLKEIIKTNCNLLIDLDGVAGYAITFIEEVFGGLVRHHGFLHDITKERISFKSEEDSYLIEEIKGFVSDMEKVCDDI